MDSQYSSPVIYPDVLNAFCQQEPFAGATLVMSELRLLMRIMRPSLPDPQVAEIFLQMWKKWDQDSSSREGVLFLSSASTVSRFLLQNLTATSSSQIYLHQSGRLDVEQSWNVTLFLDLTPLLNGSALPCPKVGPVEIRHPQRDLNKGPCSQR